MDRSNTLQKPCPQLRIDCRRLCILDPLSCGVLERAGIKCSRIARAKNVCRLKRKNQLPVLKCSTLPKARSRTAETTSGRRNFALYWRHYIRYSNVNGFGHTVFFYQLFISLSAICSTFRLLFSSPRLIYKIDNHFIHLLVLLLWRYLKSCLFSFTLYYLFNLFKKI
jgi:hypothetical protein